MFQLLQLSLPYIKFTNLRKIISSLGVTRQFLLSLYNPITEDSHYDDIISVQNLNSKDNGAAVWKRLSKRTRHKARRLTKQSLVPKTH
jgi:hypothetical protein